MPSKKTTTVGTDGKSSAEVLREIIGAAFGNLTSEELEPKLEMIVEAMPYLINTRNLKAMMGLETANLKLSKGFLKDFIHDLLDALRYAGAVIEKNDPRFNQLWKAFQKESPTGYIDYSKSRGNPTISR